MKNIVFMGTPSYASRILDEIYKEGFNILAIYTQPDKPVGRSGELTPPDVKKTAINLGLASIVYQPNSLKDDGVKEHIKSLNPDIIIVAAYGQILPVEILDIAPCVNLHASILPAYRGASPIQSSILDQNRLSGVTAMKMDEGLDSGDILAFSVIDIAKLNSQELFEKLSDIAANLTIKILKEYEKIVKECSLLIRTAAYNADIHCVLEEIDKLVSEYEELVSTAKTRPKNFLLKKAETPLFSSIKELEYKDGDRLITDDKEIYDNLLRLYNSNELKGDVCPEFYEDKLLPLYKLYSFEKIFSEISSKKVWLKSGAYLVIEHTEALTVVDVNTGKCDKGKNKEETFFKINQEAAEVISRQLRLRNISGIIIIDFIDMAELTMRNKLKDVMKRLVSDDKIKTTVVDFTKLNLMELTRKKTRDLLKVRNDLFEKL